MSDRRRPDSLGFLAVFGFVLFVGILGAGSGAARGQLADTDAYSWANRAVELREGGWFDETIDRVSPAGHVQHWSRPFDVLVVAGATTFAPAVGFSDGLRIWAFALPVLLGAAAVAVVWVTFSETMGGRDRVALCALLVGQAPILLAFLPGRVDHQALYVPLVALLVYSASRHVGARETDRWLRGLGVGVLAGLCLWVAMETVLVVGVVLVVYGLRWVLGVDATTRGLATVLVGLSSSTAVALFVENGTAAFDRRPFDELSLIFPIFFIFALAGSALLARLQPDPGLPRFRAAIVVAGAAASVMVLAFPALLAGPLGEVDPFYAEIRLANIVEIQPIVGSSIKETLTRFVLAFYFVPLAFVALAHSMRRIGPRDWFVQTTGPWQFAAAVTLLYAPLTIWQVRWSPILAVFSSPFAAVVLGRALRAKREVFQLLSALLFVFSWIAVLVLAGAEPVDRCDPIDLRDVASAMEGRSGGVLLAMTDYGPQLLFETDYEVLSIPNHRYQAGFKPSFEIFNSSDEELQRSLVGQFDITSVLVCTSDNDSAFFRAEPGSLHERLQEGAPPAWLVEIGDFRPSESRPFFRFYEVDATEFNQLG